MSSREPSVVTSIADAVVIKYDDLFLLTTPDGRVPLDGNHGFGLYYHDCRFLNGYEIRVAGEALTGLAATAASGFMAVLQLTNPDLRTEDGRLIPKEQVSLKWKRVIDSEHTSPAEVLTFHNFGVEPLELPISVTFRSEFEDVFEVRGFLAEQTGRCHSPRWQDGVLSFIYEGSDGLFRCLTIQFSAPPTATESATAHFRNSLFRWILENRKRLATLSHLPTSHPI